MLAQTISWPETLARLRLNQSNVGWVPWLMRYCAILGMSLFLSGVICFFAFNWAVMSKWLKFGLIEGGFLLCLAAVWKLGPESRGGAYLTVAASVLVGIFFAVFGQVYQTGANTWQLFALWAALILPWTLLARNPAQWCLLLALLNIAALLRHIPDDWGMYVELMALNGLALAARETAVRTDRTWLGVGWTGIVPLLVLLPAATMPVTHYILHYQWRPALPCMLGCVCLIGVWRYFRAQKDVVRLSLVALCGFPLLNAVFFRCFKRMPDLEIATFLFFAALNIGYAALIATCLRTLHKHSHGNCQKRDDASAPDENPPEPSLSLKTPLPFFVVQVVGGILGAVCLAVAMALAFHDAIKGIGIFLLCIATFVHRLLHSKDGVHNASISFCLSLVLVGLGMFWLNTSDLDLFSALGARTVIAVFLYALFPNALVRFIATIFLLGGITALLVNDYDLAMTAYLMALLTVLCCLPLVLWAADVPLPSTLKPGAYACVTLLTVAFIPIAGLGLMGDVLNRFMAEMLGVVANTGQWMLGISIFLLSVVEWRRARLNVRPPSPIIVLIVIVALAALLWLGDLGALLTVCLLALGHGRRETPLGLMGILFLPWFLFAYYYSLHMTLLTKSYILMGSGLIAVCILALLAYMDRKEASCSPS